MKLLHCPSCGAKSFTKKGDRYVCKYCASEIISDQIGKEETPVRSKRGWLALFLLAALIVAYIVYRYSPSSSTEFVSQPEKMITHRSTVVTSKSWSYFSKSKKPFILKSASVDHVNGKYIFCGKEGNKEYEKYFSAEGKQIGKKELQCSKNLSKTIPYLNGKLSIADKVEQGDHQYIVLTYQDHTGNLLWSKRFRSAREDSISHIIRGVDDVVLLVGYSVSSTSPVQYSWIIQLPDDIENSSLKHALRNIDF